MQGYPHRGRREHERESVLKGFVHNNKTNKTKLIHVCLLLVISIIISFIVFFLLFTLYLYIYSTLSAHNRLASSCAPIEFKSLCNRSTVILACSPAATVSSYPASLSMRACSKASISSAVLPVAHTRKIYPNCSSYNLLCSARLCNVSSLAPSAPFCSSASHAGPSAPLLALAAASYF